MSIKVLPPTSRPPMEISIAPPHEALLIKEIAEKVGMISAMRVLRWLTNCSLASAKEFVEHGLKDVHPAQTVMPTDNIKVCETKEDENESR